MPWCLSLRGGALEFHVGRDRNLSGRAFCCFPRIVWQGSPCKPDRKGLPLPHSGPVVPRVNCSTACFSEPAAAGTAAALLGATGFRLIRKSFATLGSADSRPMSRAASARQPSLQINAGQQGLASRTSAGGSCRSDFSCSFSPVSIMTNPVRQGKPSLQPCWVRRTVWPGGRPDGCFLFRVNSRRVGHRLYCRPQRQSYRLRLAPAIRPYGPETCRLRQFRPDDGRRKRKPRLRLVVLIRKASAPNRPAAPGPR